MAYSEAVYWLAALSTQAPPKRVVKRVLYTWCIEHGRSAASLFNATADEIAQVCGLTLSEAQATLGARSLLDRAQRTVEELERWGARVITRAEDAYPEEFLRLEAEWQPYYAVYQGDLTLLTEPGVAVLGAVHPDVETANLAQSLAQWLVQQGHHLVGGFDEGVDRLALEAASAVGGAVVIVLAEGLLKQRSLFEGREEGGKAVRLLLSPFAPDAPWRENQAVARRALILALCGAAFFLAPDEGLSRWPCVVDLAREGLSVFVWQRGGEPIPAEWVEIGARPFKGMEDLRYTLGEGLEPLRIGEAEGEPEDEPPIVFRDAQEAIARLEQTGKVPEKLAKRLRAALPKGPADEISAKAVDVDHSANAR